MSDTDRLQQFLTDDDALQELMAGFSIRAEDKLERYSLAAVSLPPIATHHTIG